MEKILITGGAGYIGSHTAVALLEAGYQPIIIDDFSNSEKSALLGLKKITGQEIPCYEGDCNDADLMDRIFTENKLSGVIHFAAFKAVGESSMLPLKYYNNNISSLLVLLATMDKHNVENLVFSSSCTVYGQPDKLPVKESTPRKKAESPYGNTKKICEDILVDQVNSKVALSAIALRYFNPIGAHTSSEIGELPLGVPSNLVPFVTQTGVGIRKELTVFGDDYDTPDGTCVRDYIHVMDLAEAHVKAISHLKGKTAPFYDIFNVGTGNGNTVMDVIKAFEKVSGRPLNYKVGPRRPGDVVKVWADTSKINQELNWKARFNLEEALRDSWNWQLALSKK
ncbi:UDP-glucose 4-epimerase GalE [Cyclobacterium amurskyense]|uniref:UDP-glucose 4-epimerase n=1 Tax=Cyclobacterium amurskyense TaxID=320787 RepID=A0A0H4PGX3_9BACT|nr:UDP-glucose 4-epimerase GalE [Cyclobacterium amurskyense]AKP52295.1 UDP-glucose 4-epimerase [Cyclobacterium amurskyense]|tara:strand:+ start:450 stop:1466 length:1017 start_codon:yes stop_codon:yes gene_type:complete